MPGRLRVVFLGHARYSAILLDTLLRVPEAEVVGILTRNVAPNADACSLACRAMKARIPCLAVDDLPQSAWADWILRHKGDVAYAFGWSTMLRPEVLAAPTLGVIGYHPTRLPRNRGHHPIIWTLALGLEETASTFLLLNDAVDAGDIVSQVRVGIDPSEDAGTLYDKLTHVAAAQIPRFTRELARGELARVPQDHAQATWWRRRGYDDGRIDWRMSAAGIDRLVRALARPYDGAHCTHRGRDVKIWKTRPVQTTGAARDMEPGRVLASEGARLVVKCGEAGLEILEHEFDVLPAAGKCL